MTFCTAVLFLTTAGASALNVVTSEKSALKAVTETLRASALKIETFQTGVSARRLDSHTGGGGMMDPKCQEACPKTMDMLTDMMQAMAQTSTTPAPGTEMESMKEALCPHSETLTCLGTEAACKDESTEAMGAIVCLCDCPDVILLISGGEDAGEGMCKAPEMLDCLFSKPSCAPMKEMMTASASGVTPETMKKMLKVECARNDLGCTEKMEKTGECAGEALTNWGAAGCEEDMTEECCPFAETLVGCMGKECTKLSTAVTKIMADAGDENMQKELKKSLERGKACPGVGLPATEEEAEAIVAATTSSGGGESEPPATGFAAQAAPMLAAAMTLCAVVA